MASSRDLACFSNLAVVPNIVRLCRTDDPPRLLVGALGLSALLSAAFHATEGDSFRALGMTLSHDIDDGLLVRACLGDDAMEWGGRFTNELLIVDEIGALLALSATMMACGGFVQTLNLAASRKHRLVVATAFTAFAVSDLLLKGWAYAAVHSVWHALAFTIPVLLYTSLDRDTKTA